MKTSRVALFLLTAGLVLFAGKKSRPRFLARRITRISRVVSDVERAERFYRDAIGFRTIARGHLDPVVLAALGLGGVQAEQVVMRLGEQIVALVCFTPPGRPYPSDSSSNDLWFQHLAIVVRDMDAAYAHLSRAAGWQPISKGGPQLLPPSNGAVRAFKFRDPDGHPLELIWFPPGQGRAVWHQDRTDGLFLGVDHSALAISSTRRSLTFYRAFGFKVSERSLNHGPAQVRMDGLPGARARITGLRPAQAEGPGLELLGYQPPGASAGTTFPNDIVTDWVTVEVNLSYGDSCRAMRDPDGHLLVVVDQGADGIGLPA